MTLKIVTNLPKNENDLLSFGLDELAKLGAKRILTQALLLETEEYVNAFKDEKDSKGYQLVVKNGKGRPRKITTGAGTIEAQAPRINDRRDGEKFESKILPPYLRKSPNVESILPLLYLKGLSPDVIFKQLKKMEEEKESLGLKLERHKEDYGIQQMPLGLKDYQNFLRKVRADIALSMPDEIKCKIAKLLIHKVKIFDQHIEIEFKTGEGLLSNFRQDKILNKKTPRRRIILRRGHFF